MVKSASVVNYSAPGTAITYSYKITNTGNVDLTAVSVTDLSRFKRHQLPQRDIGTGGV